MSTQVIQKEEILQKLKSIISEITLMEESEIDPSLSLVNDLGMESIDFLDVAFKIESAFNIEIPRRNPIQRISSLIGPERILQDGKLTEDGVKLLNLIFPDVDKSKIYVGLPEGAISALITTKTYVGVVRRGLELATWNPGHCEHCTKNDLKKLDKSEVEFPDDIVPIGPVYQCNSCQKIMVPPSFDQEICQKMDIAL